MNKKNLSHRDHTKYKLVVDGDFSIGYLALVTFVIRYSQGVLNKNGNRSTLK